MLAAQQRSCLAIYALLFNYYIMYILTANSLSMSETQEILDTHCSSTARMELPPADQDVVFGVQWGLAECPFTPAFWAAQLWFDRSSNQPATLRWGPNLVDEVAGCLLGGHGITWEMNNAAFCRLAAAGVLSGSTVTQRRIVDLLSQPFQLGSRVARYRFPNQKGKFVSDAINRLAMESPPFDRPLVFREWMMRFRGIGPKTASWVTRNFLGFPRVAVLDIHVIRACLLMRLFPAPQNLTKQYSVLEQRYLALADGIAAEPGRLDAVIWKTMRQAGRLVARTLRRAADVDG
jgi:N-glycosylase/DNA lyase